MTKLPASLDAIARAIAPVDLGADVPLYFVRTSEANLPPALRVENVRGLTSQFMDIAARPYLKTNGRWRGRGPCILLGDALLQAEAERDGGKGSEFADELFRSRLLAVAVHELGHVLEQPFDPTEHGEPSANSKAASAAVSAWTARAADGYKPSFPWSGHDLHFVRVLCHAVDRAERLLGRRLPDQWLLGRGYGLSLLCLYRGTLEQELSGPMAGESFETIRVTPPPVAFLELWRRDVLQYMNDFDAAGVSAAG